jgi:hypothetical protein
MTPQEAYDKCYNENRRIPELESVIATDPEHSYLYAIHVINGRFEECEKTIATDSYWSYYYACYVIDSPFQLCHPIIFNSEYRKEYIEFLKSINYDLSEIGEWLL